MRVDEALRVLKERLGDPAPSPSELLSVLNDAGEYFFQAHEWRFLVREAYLDIPAQVTLEDGTWDETTLTLTFSGTPLAGFSLIDGTKLEVTDGTGAEDGFYPIVSVTNNTITLSVSIGADADAETDIEGVIHSYAIALPDDFGDMIPGFPVGRPSQMQAFGMRDMAAVRNWRATQSGGGGITSFIGALEYGVPSPEGVVTLHLEYAPELTAGQRSALVICYRATWVQQTSATGTFRMPSFLNPAFKECLRHFALGYYEEDEATLDQRLAGFESGRLLANAIDSDSSIQVDFGPVSGGALERTITRGPLHDFEIEEPS